MATYDQNLVFNGLGTQSVTVPFVGVYFIEGHTSLPTLVGGGGASELLTTVNQNGSPVYVGPVGAEGFKTQLNCAVNDVIDVVYSSSAAADQPLNVIKSNVSIGMGE